MSNILEILRNQTPNKIRLLHLTMQRIFDKHFSSVRAYQDSWPNTL